MNNELDPSHPIWAEAAEENLEATEAILEMLKACEDDDDIVELN